jgi:formylmethanofuran:tetrahydromethanopterin formyltransferase
MNEPLKKGRTMNRRAIRHVSSSTAAAATTRTTAAASMAAAALAASIILSPAAGASARLDGVQADLARAVQLNQITAEQAARFEAKLAGRILGEG